MDTSAARRMALSLMAEHGVTGSFSFKFDRSVSRRGLTSYKGRFISLSESLTRMSTENETKMTILHEIAHALRDLECRAHCPEDCKGHHHDARWREILISIGGDGQRTSKREVEIKRHIEIHCRNHGYFGARHKMIANFSKRYCVKCGPNTKTLFAKNLKTGTYTYQ